MPFDLNRCSDLTAEASAAVDDMFEYHRWSVEQTNSGTYVRESLAQAVKVIIANVPPCPTRTVAIRKLFEARMDCNAAITHRGKY